MLLPEDKVTVVSNLVKKNISVFNHALVREILQQNDMNSIGKVVKMDGQCTKQQKFLEYLER
jgi:hypothetical protein